MLPWSWATERLAASRNYWIGTAHPDGRPHAAPVWGLWHDDAVVFGTNPESRKGRNIERNPLVVVHLESGDEVVILEGTIDRVEIDDAVADAYKAKYAFRPGLGLWYRLLPKVAYAWLEHDYPRSATRYDWDS